MAATTYVGFYTPSSPEVIQASVRGTGAAPAEFRAKINGLPASLPPTCKLIGSWAVSGGQRPGVIVVEAESFADLAHINNYYSGWLQFEWHPTNSGGVPRNQ